MRSRQQNAVSTITDYGWLAGCREDFRDWVIANLRWQVFAAGSGITHAGDDEGALYCVGDGQVHFVAGLGVADIGTSYLGLPGVWWGHAPLIGGGRVGSTVASVDMLCGKLPMSVLRTRFATHPGDWEQITLGLSDLFLLSAGAHADLLIPDNLRRMAATILRLGGWRHRRYRIKPPESFVCTQEQLAGATALSRNTAGKLVRRLEADGFIDASYGRIAILNASGLRKLANEN